MTTRRNIYRAIVLLLLLFLTYRQLQPAPTNDNLATMGTTADDWTVGGALGVTGATTLSSSLAVTGATTLSNSLAVTGALTGSSTADIAGNLQYSAANLYPIGHPTPGAEIYYATGSITSTVVTSATTGIAAPAAYGCSLNAAPSASAGAAFTCAVSVTDGDLTITNYQDDATAASTPAAASYWAIGQ